LVETWSKMNWKMFENTLTQATVAEANTAVL
jgi:hypothetical protein